MRYPTLSVKDAHAFALQVSKDPRTANSTAAAAFCAQFAGSLPTIGSVDDRPIDIKEFAKVSAELEVIIQTPKMATANNREVEKVESDFCGAVHEALYKLPIEVLDDQRFWRFLAVRYCGEFILWRESDALSSGNISKYFVAGSGVDSIPLRLFLRGQAIRSSTGSYSLAKSVQSGTDFWRSHILRVRTGRATNLARSFANMQSKDRLPTGPLRQLAKRINRMWANYVLTEYSSAACDELIEELREKVEED